MGRDMLKQNKLETSLRVCFRERGYIVNKHTWQKVLWQKVFFFNHILVLRNTCIFIVKSQFLETYGTLSYWMGFRFSGSNKDTTQRWIIYEMSLFLFENYLSCLNVGIPDLIGDLCLSRDQGPFVLLLCLLLGSAFIPMSKDGSTLYLHYTLQEGGKDKEESISILLLS